LSATIFSNSSLEQITTRILTTMTPPPYHTSLCPCFFSKPVTVNYSPPFSPFSPCFCSLFSYTIDLQDRFSVPLHLPPFERTLSSPALVFFLAPIEMRAIRGPPCGIGLLTLLFPPQLVSVSASISARCGFLVSFLSFAVRLYPTPVVAGLPRINCIALPLFFLSPARLHNLYQNRSPA